MTSAAVYLTLGALLMRVADRRATKIYCMAVAMLLAVLVGIDARLSWRALPDRRPGGMAGRAVVGAVLLAGRTGDRAANAASNRRAHDGL